MANELICVIKSPGLWRGPLPWMLVLFIGANVAVSHWHADLLAAKQKNLLLPTNTKDNAPGAVPRFDRSGGERFGEFVPFIPDTTRQPVNILCGMSQMYSINDPKPGDQTIVECLDDALAPKGARAFGLAAPNLCNEEAHLIFQALLQKPTTTPSTFVFAVCFDKFRNVDLRPGLSDYMMASPALQARLTQAADRYANTFPAAAAKIKSTLESLSRVDSGSVAEPTFESRLRSETARALPAVLARKEMNATIQMQFGTLRNALLGISNTSKRPILKARYEQNCQFLEMLVAECKRENVRVILYVIPLNPAGANPYVAAEYDDFKRWIAGVATKNDVPFANLEGLVPPEEWGLLNGEPDYKHFKGVAHKRTADALVQRFGDILIQGRR